MAGAFGERLAGGAYPSGAVFVTLPPAQVDVNVHPQKAEVRFADEQRLLETVQSLLATGLYRQAASKPPESASAAPPSSSRAPSRPTFSRGPGFWDERLGLGKLRDGQKVGTATAVRQGRARSGGGKEITPARSNSASVTPEAAAPQTPRALETRVPEVAPPKARTPECTAPEAGAAEACSAPSPARPPLSAGSSSGPPPTRASSSPSSPASVGREPVSQPPSAERALAPSSRARLSSVLDELEPAVRSRLLPAITEVVRAELEVAVGALQEQVERLAAAGHRDAATGVREAIAVLRRRLRDLGRDGPAEDPRSR